jgi:MoaA/NifB/PqqE/SkfB family radical SAM enzyme
MLDNYPALKEGYTFLVQPFGGQIYLATDIASKIGIKRYGHDVNREGAAILKRCTGSKTVQEIVDEICVEFDDVSQSVEPKVAMFLEEAVTKGYITPFKAIVEVTSACNLRCRHCYGECGAPRENELTKDEFFTILDALYEMGTEGLNISGGEPLLRKDLLEILDYCHGKFSFSLLSNGTLVDEEFAREFSKYNSPFQASIYGYTAEDHEEITQVPGSFEATVRGIRHMVQNGVYVLAAYLYKPGNVDYIEKMAQFCSDLGVAVFRVGALVTVGRGKDLGWEVSPSEFQRAAELLNKLDKEYEGRMTVQPWAPGGEAPKEQPAQTLRTGCGVGSYIIVVGSNGDLLPCGLMRMKFGNLLKENPRELFAQDHTQFFSTIQIPSSRLCGDCEFLYRCERCHAEAAAHFSRVEKCAWYEQLEKAPEIVRKELQRITS